MLSTFDVIKTQIDSFSQSEKDFLISQTDPVSNEYIRLYLACTLNLADRLAETISSMNAYVNAGTHASNWPSSTAGIRNGFNISAILSMYGISPVSPAVSEVTPAAEQNISEDTEKCPGILRENGEDGEFNTSKGLRRKSEAGKGKQSGTEGHGFKVPEDVVINSPINYMPEKCLCCPRIRECLQKASVIDTQLKYECMITTYRNKFVALQCVCPEDGSVLKGCIDESVDRTSKFGDSIRSRIVYLRDVGLISLSRISEMSEALCGFHVSVGTIDKICNDFGDIIKPAVETLREDFHETDYACADETSVRLNGKKIWAHTLVTASTVYVALSSFRGLNGMTEIGVLPMMCCVLQHDFWKAYFNLPNVIHAMCNAHLLRELRKIMDFHPDQYMPAFGLFNLLMEMHRERRKAIEEEKKHLDPAIFESFWERYDVWVQMGILCSPDPVKKPGRGRIKKNVPLNLFERMRDHKEEILLFLVSFDIAFSNNRAEASFRMLKVTTKVSGTFRNRDYADNYMRRFSYLQTCRLRKIDRFTAISRAFAGEAAQVIIESKPSA